MLKIFKSFFVVAAVAAVAGTATWSYFSDEAVSDDNTFSSGTLDLQLTDSDETDAEGVSASFGETDLVPGDILPEKELTIANVGSIDGHHLNLKVTLTEDNDLAKNIIFKKADADHGLRFGISQNALESTNLVDELFGLGGDTDYDVFHNDGTPFDLTTDLDGDGELSLYELAQIGTIRIEIGVQDGGIAAGSEATLWMNAKVDTDLAIQGETTVATFTWEIQQDASQVGI